MTDFIKYLILPLLGAGLLILVAKTAQGGVLEDSVERLLEHSPCIKDMAMFKWGSQHATQFYYNIGEGVLTTVDRDGITVNYVLDKNKKCWQVTSAFAPIPSAY